MRLKFSFFSIAFALVAMTAAAQDFGAHVGYYGGDLKQAYVGADMMVPIGPAAISPNVDFSRKNGVNWWFASVDLNLKNPGGGPMWWFGAGPTYGYTSGGGGSGHDWGWDVNGGLAFATSGMRPYVTARYIKIKDFTTTGAAIGLRF